MSYKVLKGDGWYRIAKRQGININDLLKANNATLDTVIHPGLILKIPNQPTSLKSTASKPTNGYFSEVMKKVIQTSNLNNPEELFVYNLNTPQKVNLVTKKESLTDIQTKQAALVAAGYDLGKSGINKDGVDGNWGRKSETAWKQAMLDGYVYENGRLIKPNLKSKRSSIASYLYSINPMFGTPINSSATETSVSIPNFSEIPVELLKQIYKEGPGTSNAAGTMLFHVVSPQSFSMPHTDGLKNQVAAAIAYNESLPQNKRERDANGIQTDDEGYQYVGYNTFGILSGQSGNVNNQGTEANAASKVMGGLRYRINEDGSIDVKDKYGFNVVRDFELTNSKGKPKVMSKEEKANDKYAGKPWLGLWHDLTSKHSKIISDNATWRPSTWFDSQGLQDLAENVGTRQGKVRDNSFVFAPGEISKRLGL